MKNGTLESPTTLPYLFMTEYRACSYLEYRYVVQYIQYGKNTRYQVR
jgi:hypothetical protein